MNFLLITLLIHPPVKVTYNSCYFFVFSDNTIMILIIIVNERVDHTFTPFGSSFCYILILIIIFYNVSYNLKVTVHSFSLQACFSKRYRSNWLIYTQVRNLRATRSSHIHYIYTHFVWFTEITVLLFLCKSPICITYVYLSQIVSVMYMSHVWSY